MVEDSEGGERRYREAGRKLNCNSILFGRRSVLKTTAGLALPRILPSQVDDAQSDFTSLWTVPLSREQTVLRTVDTDGDDIDEIVVSDKDARGPSEYGLIDDGEWVWQESSNGDVIPSEVGDVDGDGLPEVVIRSKVSPIWIRPYTHDGEYLWSGDHADWPDSGYGTDIDDDGLTEIMALSSNRGDLSVFDEDGTVLWRTQNASLLERPLGFADINDDGRGEILTNQPPNESKQGVHVIRRGDGNNAEVLWSYGPSVPVDAAFTRDDSDVVAVVAYPDSGEVHGIDSNGSQVWTQNIGWDDIEIQVFEHNNGATAIAWKDSEIRFISSGTTEVKSFTTSSPIERVFEHDGTQVAVKTENGISIGDGDEGVTSRHQTDRRVTAVSFGDIDGDGEQEVLVGYTDELVAYTSSQQATPNETGEDTSAVFDITPSPAQSGIDVEFDATVSTGEIQRYQWDFDTDSEFEKTGRIVSHTFSEPKQQQVTLRVTDTAGEATTSNQTLTVQPSESDVDITIENNFVGEDRSTVWKMVFDEAQEAFSFGIGDNEPEEEEAYINVDITVQIPNAQELGIESITPTFESPDWEASFGPGAVQLPRVEDDKFEKTILIATVGQMGLKFVEAAALVAGARGVRTGEIDSAMESRTSNYPNVSLSKLLLEYRNGNTQEIDVDRELPRYVDTCPENVLSSLLSPKECNMDKYTESDITEANGVAALSPVNLHVKDENGRKVGQVESSDGWQTVNEIPNAIYSGPLNDEFVILPSEGEYIIEAVGTASGSVTLLFDTVTTDDNPTVTTNEYREININSGTVLQSSFEETSLQIDTNGTGEFDNDIEAQSVSMSPSEFIINRFPDQDSDENSNYGYTIQEIAAGGAITAGLAYLTAHILTKRQDREN